MQAEWALFASAFLGATLLPISSEAAFVTALLHGMPSQNAMLFASSGNILAILTNYALGYFLYQKMHTQLHTSSFGTQAFALGKRYGYFGLLLSWLPLIGDPLTVVAGLLRIEFVWFLLIAGSLRIARYGFLVQIMQ